MRDSAVGVADLDARRLVDAELTRGRMPGEAAQRGIDAGRGGAADERPAEHVVVLIDGLGVVAWPQDDLRSLGSLTITGSALLMRATTDSFAGLTMTLSAVVPSLTRIAYS